MPQMADITVKKNDGVTNITYTGVSPSSGDKTAAVWKSLSVGTSNAFQPELRLTSRETSLDGKPARAVRVTYVYPMTVLDGNAGFTYVFRRMIGSAEFIVPKDMASIDSNEACAQLGNLIASALIQACAKSGYSAS